ncbi:hypothetical protein [Mesorhizobium sp. L2C067A000]|uniref:hypothetical protein n=2 Tax=unclassified Mesorhizobium TaxID=325217 RepID=UPI0003CFCD30|nr:hypothetical protein [Mesorhizobium sp. L2C067A000]ESZ29666.1 hypothetical protein X733_25935 [Mesorhizobium sp. L2C067A000]
MIKLTEHAVAAAKKQSSPEPKENLEIVSSRMPQTRIPIFGSKIWNENGHLPGPPASRLERWGTSVEHSRSRGDALIAISDCPDKVPVFMRRCQYLYSSGKTAGNPRGPWAGTTIAATPILLATTKRAERAHPGQARKTAAKLQAFGYPAYF